MDTFHPVVRAWFQETFGQPSPPQAQGWPAIVRGEHTLILAPTGSGKTLAAFLQCLNSLYQDPGDGGVQVLYISPLKALNNDIHRNLEVPLQGIAAKAQAMGVDLPRLTTAVRTGDTSPKERAAMLKRPPHVLITTPESLYLLLTSKARNILRSVRYVIVDEIHAIAATKRGVHLSLSLERLEAQLERPPVRIGLSATQRPLEEIARFLGGTDRPVTIVDTGTRKTLDLQVEVPVEDMRALPEGSIWPAMHPRLLELIQQHKSTLIFVNSRALAERLAGRLNALAGGEICKVHHGSMSREAREIVELALKEGRLPALVATSSLELGIDVGAIDLVIQVESPGSVARGLQRVGRAGHVVGAASKGRLLPKWRGDLLETACIVREMKAGSVEETRVPTGCLDVLAQQVIAMAAMDDWPVADLLALLRRSYCYRDLTDRQLHTVLEMLDGRYPAAEFQDLRPRIVWDREAGIIRARENAQMLAILAGGTIPDRGYYGVYLHGTNVKLGELDEEFIFESGPGDHFLLGTNTWRIQAIEHDRITVTDAFGATPRMPFWKGEGIGRPFAMGLKVGAFTRELEARLDAPETPTAIAAECALTAGAAANLLTYLRDQLAATGALAHDRQLVVEYFWDEMGDRRIVIHSPFGGRVHQAWSLILKRRLRDIVSLEAELLATDDGLLIRLPGAETPPPIHALLRLTPQEAEEILMDEVGQSALFGAYFRMNAARSLVLPRPRPGRRRPFWLQRLRAADLLQVARKYAAFPVVLETYREVLRDVLDLAGLRQVLTGIATGEIGVHVVETATPSPMAANVMMGFVGAHMYGDETPKAERKGALLRVNRDLLREILGSEALRELLSPQAIQEIQARLQRLDPEWHPRNADEAEELLRRLGDLTAAELAARGVAPAWLEALQDQRRALPVASVGEVRWIAAGDEALYADPVGYAGALIRRYARNHGPFLPQAVAVRYGYDAESVLRYLAVLQAEGIVAAGEYTQGATEREYCDTDVLQQIHRRTLTLLRREVQPVDGAAFARFLASWHSLRPAAAAAGATPGAEPAAPAARREKAGPHALRRALTQLQGVPLPAEVWERDILPARVPGYQPLWLDQLCATGELHWAAAPGGKLAFYLPEQVEAFAARLQAPPPDSLPPSERQVLTALQTGGADFLGGVARTAGLSPRSTLDGLWALVWAGLVTNDTFAPVRQVLATSRSGAKRSKAPPSLQSGTGRWSLAAKLVRSVAADPAETYARILLERYGVACREAAHAEDGPVDWPGVLAALKRMELQGQVRQGYFVAGLSGAQFALPAAVDQLRAARDRVESTAFLLAACDPANPYGAMLPVEGARAARIPSTALVLVGGKPVLAVEGSGKRLTPLPDLLPAQLRTALAALAGLLQAPAAARTRKRLEVEFWGDVPILQSDVQATLQEVGFQRLPQKLVLYR